jgi:hypothetical protein
MRLVTEKINLKGGQIGRTTVEDQDTGRVVGTQAYATNDGRRISLFDGAYKGHFDSHEECAASKR